MSFLTFGVGPSKLSAETAQDLRNAADLQIAEISHRSQAFAEISRRALGGLRTFLRIPDSYHILYTSSASEAMELTIQSTVELASFHFAQGKWSQYFADIAKHFRRRVLIDTVEWGQKNDFRNTFVPTEADLITICHSETSTGVACDLADIRAVRHRFPSTFLAVDGTSIMGAVAVDIALADIWLFSVQKCFGLPAGLGVMIVHERVFERAADLIARGVHNPGVFNLPAMFTMVQKDCNTVATPNVLGIYLLAQQMERWNAQCTMESRERETREKAELLGRAIEKSSSFRFLVRAPEDRSPTVCCVRSDPQTITSLHALCRAQGIELGKGYGKLKEETVRIANFPAITCGDIQRLLQVLEHVRSRTPAA
ncbi:hypothetical protein A2454_06065 [Candidatus Peribacteria bacterium RIFOXYC2_FULL_55_14]|nr:MAG: hypothetical protein A2198_03500 [Candidatus Peribacteria bacterium RIFOXYA1_FULL_56_14]OGJ72728.1 MAG: hypothetical protein A2217_04560 [Candidatus Peribacteria bacterium RIFOXYA2_FULL_55_28]OGJ75367.1 MAG: hypothetical protein A2384_00495 [Candidatus Peribacteria bacterium RIFOXYB1_FULL_54_35]OGJ76456.1 MAG: hypothetical protein A2327_01375 [Candidatus Peribacteria bacterium RIFOXYB2_FULL_54_17]OGJ79473.1 MAG: hypothetical protein A2424_01610 [Candidatus Peribacteria bacterium RIFOXYC